MSKAKLCKRINKETKKTFYFLNVCNAFKCGKYFFPYSSFTLFCYKPMRKLLLGLLYDLIQCRCRPI